MHFFLLVEKKECAMQCQMLASWYINLRVDVGYVLHFSVHGLTAQNLHTKQLPDKSQVWCTRNYCFLLYFAGSCGGCEAPSQRSCSISSCKFLHLKNISCMVQLHDVNILFLYYFIFIEARFDPLVHLEDMVPMFPFYKERFDQWYTLATVQIFNGIQLFTVSQQDPPVMIWSCWIKHELI